MVIIRKTPESSKPSQLREILGHKNSKVFFAMHWIYTKIQRNFQPFHWKDVACSFFWWFVDAIQTSKRCFQIKIMIWKKNTGFLWKPNETFGSNPISPALTNWNFALRPPAATTADTGPKDQKPTALTVLKATCTTDPVHSDPVRRSQSTNKECCFTANFATGRLPWYFRENSEQNWPILPSKRLEISSGIHFS